MNRRSPDCCAAGLLAAAPARRRSRQPTGGAPLTLQRVLEQARANSQPFRAAQLASDLAVEDAKQARAALLPSVNGFSQYIYTAAERHAVRRLGAERRPERLRDVAERARRRLLAGEVGGVSRRGRGRSRRAREGRRGGPRSRRHDRAELLHAGRAQRKLASAQQALREAQQFLDITRQQESGGEVAHADVVKAQIQVAQRTRDAQDAELAVLKSRLGLSVLVFPDFRDTFTVVDDLQTMVPLLPLDATSERRRSDSPDLRAAEAAVQQETFGVDVARGGVLPSVSFDYFYGINANQFATHDPDGHLLLGSVAQVQLNVPLWTWGAAQSKLTQAQLRVQAAKASSRWRSGSCRPTSAPFTAKPRSRATRSPRCASRSISPRRACG